MKKTVWLLIAALAAGCTAVSSSSAKGLGMANPWTDCTDKEEAEKIAGFSFAFPESLGNGEYTVSSYRAMDGMIDAAYEGKKGSLTIRQTPESGEDISGDYNSYEETKEITAGDLTLSVRCNAGRIYVTSFDYEDMSYVLYTGDGAEEEEIAAIAAEVKD